MSEWVVVVTMSHGMYTMHAIKANTSTEAIMLALTRTGLPSNIISIKADLAE